MKTIHLLSIFSFVLFSCEEQSVGQDVVTPTASGQSSEHHDNAASREPNFTSAPTKKTSSVYTPYLEGKIQVLKDGKMVPSEHFKEPSKYYLFYKTASWCPPCQRFTPKLVEFYKQQKAIYGDAFEIILLSSDHSHTDMERYAKKRNMTWPHLELERVKDFALQFPFPGRGIPNTILTDATGAILSTSYTPEGQYLGPHTPVRVLQTLLAKND